VRYINVHNNNDIFVGLFTGIKFLEIKQFIAKIGYQNTRSLQLFKKVGFVEVSLFHMMLLCLHMNLMMVILQIFIIEQSSTCLTCSSLCTS